MTEWKSFIQVIGISGKLGSGKDYLTHNILLPLWSQLDPGSPILTLALADHLKVEVLNKCTRKDGSSFEFGSLFGPKDEESRKALQTYGTEVGRLTHGEDIWSRILETWIHSHYQNGVRRFIITDIRFLSDFEWIKKLGGKVIRIISPQRTLSRIQKETSDPLKQKEIMNHRSETELDYLPAELFDVIYNNDYDNESKIAGEVKEFVQNSLVKKETLIFCPIDIFDRTGDLSYQIFSKLKSLGTPILVGFENKTSLILRWIELNSHVSNSVNNSVSNLVSNSVGNSVNNSVNNSVSNLVSNSVNNSVSNSVSNLVSNSVISLPPCQFDIMTTWITNQYPGKECRFIYVSLSKSTHDTLMFEDLCFQ